MAIVKKLTEDYLTCIVCSEVFTTPATLHCDHTFCRPCILKYTETQAEAIAAKCIPCPVCKQLTKVANPERSVKEWVSQLKSSRTIQRLIDDFGSKQEGGDKLKRPQPFLCKRHEDEEIKLFCKVCQKPLCQICFSTSHSECKPIVSVKEVLPDITTKLLAKQQLLDGNITERIASITKGNSQIEMVQTEAEHISSEIKRASRKMMDLIRTKEQRLLEKLDELSNTQIKKLQFQLERDKIAIHVYKQQSSFIDQSTKLNSLKDIFDMYESCELENSDKDVQTADADKITFKLDNESLNKADENINLGKIYSTKAGDVGRETSPFLWRTIGTRIPEDKAIPVIADVTVVESNGFKTLVVADKKNSSIKSFHTEGSQTRINLQVLDSEPFGLTVTRNNEVLVTLPRASRMMKAWVSPDMFYMSNLSEGRSHYGIHCLDENKFVACRYPVIGKATVDVMDMEGKTLKSFPIGPHKVPKFVCGTNKGTVLVTEDTDSSLIVIALDGKVPHKYICTKEMGLSDPRGVTRTSTGDILIVSKEGNKVIQLNESGEYVRDLVTSAHGLDKPYGIFLDKDGLLYVTCGEFVMVFKFL